MPGTPSLATHPWQHPQPPKALGSFKGKRQEPSQACSSGWPQVNISLTLDKALPRVNSAAVVPGEVVVTATTETCHAVTAAPSTLQHCQSGIHVPETPVLPHHSQSMGQGLPAQWPSGNMSGAAAGPGEGPGRAEQSRRRDHPLGWAEKECVNKTRAGPSSASTPWDTHL